MASNSSTATSNLLEYDINLPGSQQQLHVISDPSSEAFEYSIGSSLWQAAIECLEFLSGAWIG
jgi:hypothetical protein